MPTAPVAGNQGAGKDANARRAAEAERRVLAAIERLRAEGVRPTLTAVTDAASCSRRTAQRVLQAVRASHTMPAGPVVEPDAAPPAQPAPPAPGEWVAVREFARWLAVPASAVYGEIHRGRLPAVRVGRHLRVRRADAASLLVRAPDASEPTAAWPPAPPSGVAGRPPAPSR